MPRRYNIREETKALGASQIMISLFHCALGTFWVFLMQLEEDSTSVGPKPLILVIAYSFASAFFFMTSGSSSVIQKVPSRSHRLILAIVLNILSILMAIVGLMILGFEFAMFEEKSSEYVWSNMAGMMLIHYLVLSTVAELILTCMVIHWMRRAFHHEVIPEKFSRSTLPEASLSESLSSESSREQYESSPSPNIVDQ